MASRTDLQGFLRQDEDNLSVRMSVAYAALDGTSVIRYRVTWRPHGAVSAERLDVDADLVDAAPRPAAVDAIVDRIERIIADRLGLSPIGTIRVVAAREGDARHPIIDMSRTLCPPDMDGSISPNEGLLRAELEIARHNLRVIGEQQVAMSATLGQLAQSLAQSLATSATARTAASAGADLHGLGAVVGLAVVLFALPAIKRELGLPADAPVGEVLRRGQALLGLAQQRAALALEAPRPPSPEDREPRADAPADPPREADSEAPAVEADPLASPAAPDGATLAELARRALAGELGPMVQAMAASALDGTPED